jgi:hypothetical protein
MRTGESTKKICRRTFLQAARTAAAAAVGGLTTRSACRAAEPRSRRVAESPQDERYGVTVVTVLPTLFLVWGDRLEDGWLADAP